MEQLKFILQKIKAQIKGIFNNKMPFEILEEFTPMDQKYLEEKGTRFPEVNEKLYVIDMKQKTSAKIGLILALAMAIPFTFAGFHFEEGFSHPVSILILSLSYFAIVYYSREIYLDRQIYITLNREKGLITFPVGIRKEKVYASPFNKVKFFWNGTGGATGNLDMKLCGKHPDKKGGMYLEGLDRNYRKLWSSYVWYMDKNRPLPPGSAFDPYRQADFERRKAEGFPKPLYRSHIPTPEATPEQQAERDKYWKDHLEEFTREPDSEMYDPKVHKNWNPVMYRVSEGKPVANTYFCYRFSNGDVVYMKTDENGKGHKPPEAESFKTVQINLIESVF